VTTCNQDNSVLDEMDGSRLLSALRKGVQRSVDLIARITEYHGGPVTTEYMLTSDIARWKSRPRGGRPRTPHEIRQLIRDMSIANPLWGAPRIHGELCKLGIDVGQTTVAKYMAKRRRPPSQRS
jgi:hypothetical protein